MLSPAAFSSRGFTLLELLIVIVIVLGVFVLGFSGLEKRESMPKVLTPLNLKSAIQNASFFNGEGTLMCVDACRKCFFRESFSSPWTPYKSPMDLRGTESYTVNSNDSLLLMEYGRFDDEQICLMIDFFRNGSSTQIILENEHGVYYLPAFFGESQKVESLEEAKELWLKHNTYKLDSGDYY